MNRRFNLVLLVISLAFGLVAATLATHAMAKQKNAAAQEQTENVVIVTRNLQSHQLVGTDDVQLKPVPSSAVQPGALTSLNDVIGHFTANAWFTAQQVISPMVVDSNQPSAFPAQIPKGYRAFTIADDPVLGVDHLISNGDRVDVLAAYSDTSHGQRIETVLQDVLVLSADQSPIPPTAPGNNSSTVSQTSTSKTDTLTLAVTPVQAQLLDFASSFGQIHVILRRPGDTASSPIAQLVPNQ